MVFPFLSLGVATFRGYYVHHHAYVNAVRPHWSQTCATVTTHQVSRGYILLLRRQNTKSHHLGCLTDDKTPSTTMIQSFFRVCSTTFPSVSPQTAAQRTRFECRVLCLSLSLSTLGTTFDLDKLALTGQSVSLGLFFLFRHHFFVRLSRYQRHISPPEGFLGTLCSHIGLAVRSVSFHSSICPPSHRCVPVLTGNHTAQAPSQSLCIRYSSGHTAWCPTAGK